MRGARRKAIVRAIREVGHAPTKPAVKATKRAWNRRHPSGASPDTGSRHHRLERGQIDFFGFRISKNRTQPQTWGPPMYRSGMLQSIAGENGFLYAILRRYATAISRLDGTLRQRIVADPDHFVATVRHYPKNPDRALARYFHPENFDQRGRRLSWKDRQAATQRETVVVHKPRSMGATALLGAALGTLLGPIIGDDPERHYP